MIEHKEVCLKVNGNQSVRLRSGSIKFKNYSKQLVVPFKIYADFESVLIDIWMDKGSNASYTRKYEAHIPCSFAYKVVCIDDKFSKSVVLYKGKMQLISSLDQFLKSIDIAKG